MNEPIMIAVTEEDIELGEKCEPHSCPIARAALRTFSEMGDPPSCVYVQLDEILVLTSLRPRTTWRTPDEAVEFIKNFDGGKEVRPFEFTLG